MHGQMIQNVKVTCAKSMNCILAPVACVYMYECVGGGDGGGGGGDDGVARYFDSCADALVKGGSQGHARTDHGFPRAWGSQSHSLEDEAFTPGAFVMIVVLVVTTVIISP